jgi:hypothetical protein
LNRGNRKKGQEKCDVKIAKKFFFSRFSTTELRGLYDSIPSGIFYQVAGDRVFTWEQVHMSEDKSYAVIHELSK